jgi:hypothetical protein
MKKKIVDLSSVYCVAELDKAQRRFDELPDELVNHLRAAFAHKAGVGAHPGTYAGRPPKVYDTENPSQKRSATKFPP